MNINIEKFLKHVMFDYLMARKDLLPEELYKILACPVCKKDLEYTKDKKGLYCKRCNHVYPIKGGIPILMPKKKR